MKKRIISIILRFLQVGVAYVLFTEVARSMTMQLLPGISIGEVLLPLYLAALVPLAYPSYYYLPVILGIVSLLITPNLRIVYNSLLLSIISFIILWANTGETGLRITSKRRLLASGIAVPVIFAALSVLGYASMLLSRKAYNANLLLQGEVKALFYLLKPTITYKLIILLLITVLLYKTASSIVELAIAWRAKGPLREALLAKQEKEEEKTLIRFEGTQYPVLDWGSGLLLTLLLAPALYPAFEALVKAILGLSHITTGSYTGVVASLIATIILWPFNKYLVQALTKPHTLAKLYKPAPEKILVASGVVIVSLLLLVDLAGYDPVALLSNVIHGELPPADPFSKLLSEPGEKYYQGLSRLLDLLVQLFWGG
ncbi:MAG: hypothetical protein GSR74_00105 [Desulfurococcales archaeon]|nr:hypothetical protein [Desulfurococcales archaeon]